MQVVSQRGRSWPAGRQAGEQWGVVQGFSCLDAREQSEGAEAGKQNRTGQVTLARTRRVSHLVFPPGRGRALLHNTQLGNLHTLAGRDTVMLAHLCVDLDFHFRDHLDYLGTQYLAYTYITHHH